MSLLLSCGTFLRPSFLTLLSLSLEWSLIPNKEGSSSRDITLTSIMGSIGLQFREMGTLMGQLWDTYQIWQQIQSDYDSESESDTKFPNPQVMKTLIDTSCSITGEIQLTRRSVGWLTCKQDSALVLQVGRSRTCIIWNVIALLLVCCWSSSVVFPDGDQWQTANWHGEPRTCWLPETNDQQQTYAKAITFQL